jgi:hypothetical protein
VYVTAADSARCNANQYFIAPRPRGREISEFQLTVLRQQQSFHFLDFEGDVAASDSRCLRGLSL